MLETLIIPISGMPYVAGLQSNRLILKSLEVLIIQFGTSSTVHI